MRYLILFLLPALLLAQQRQNMTYGVELFAREHRSGHLRDIDTLDVLTYQAWNPVRTQDAKFVLLTDLSQGFGARALTFVRDDTVIVEPDTIKFARFFRRGKRQMQQNFTMIKASAGSYDRYDDKGKLVRREFVGDPELIFKDRRFRKNNNIIKDKLKKNKQRRSSR